jgi:creatinine amidohydrolase
VDEKHFADNTGWYTKSAPEASAGLGKIGVAMILDHLRSILVS